MKKLIKRVILTIVILFGACFVYFAGVLWYGFYQEHQSFEIGRRNIEGARIIAERDAKIHEFASIIHLGTKYEEEGKYDLAIEQYKKALDVSEELDDERMARYGLADSYEKSGQYELAIQEIDWIIAQNPRQQVKGEYIARKQKIEKLMELVSECKITIENDQYQKAADKLGEIMLLCGGKTTDPKITALGATIQAYGMMHCNDSSFNSFIKQHLKIAIEKDPEWGYPKTLLNKYLEESK